MKTFFLYLVMFLAISFGYFLSYQLGYSQATNEVQNQVLQTKTQVSLGSCVESTATTVKDGINRLINE